MKQFDVHFTPGSHPFRLSTGQCLHRQVRPRCMLAFSGRDPHASPCVNTACSDSDSDSDPDSDSLPSQWSHSCLAAAIPPRKFIPTQLNDIIGHPFTMPYYLQLTLCVLLYCNIAEVFYLIMCISRSSCRFHYFSLLSTQSTAAALSLLSTACCYCFSLLPAATAL